LEIFQKLSSGLEGPPGNINFLCHFLGFWGWITWQHWRSTKWHLRNNPIF